VSEQQIVDCDSRNYGCDGGFQTFASRYLAEEGTILATDYPYTSASSSDSSNCKEDSYKKVFKLEGKGFKQIDKSYDAFKTALQQEPINISFGVGDDFLYYGSGIYTGQDCAGFLNHAM